MRRDVFRILFELTHKQPWLMNKQDILEHLLYDECNDDETRELLIELINRFEYLDTDRYQELMRLITLEIVTEPELHEKSTLIAAMSIGSGVDSGQAIIYSLKVLLQEQQWTGHLAINDAMQACKTFNKNAQLHDIILVDEFVGSGQTVLGRVKAIKEQFKNSKIDSFTIRVKVLAATMSGILNVRSQGIDITSQIIIKKGISDFYPEEESLRKIDLMVNIEEILSKEYNERALPSLGYGQAEALYYRKDTNLPNSVFPIFWWSEYKNKKKRNTLLIRAMGDA
ncbi:phosphoribosyltransferase-like protein [Morganella morganii]|uniref:phosphoribosyltransferase-like protein n=2 Tax=Morganella morganii TaxID=582 RepID=UPI003890D93A